jgi:hypothetical protein
MEFSDFSEFSDTFRGGKRHLNMTFGCASIRLSCCHVLQSSIDTDIMIKDGTITRNGPKKGPFNSITATRISPERIRGE